MIGYLIEGLILIILGAASVNLYLNRSSENNWGIFYRTLKEYKDYDEEAFNFGKILVYLGIIAIVVGVMMIFFGLAK